MSCIKEVTVLELSAEWLQSPIQLDSWVTVGDHRYIKLRKTDPKIERAICGEAPGKRRNITRTTIIEELTKLRNDAYDRACRSAQRGSIADDLGFDDDDDASSKRSKTSQLSLPPTLDIEVPPQGAVQGTTLKALTAGGWEPLWLELSETAIDYLRAAATMQASRDMSEPEEKTRSSPAPGVYWCTSKGAWRVRYYEEHKVKTRFFKPDNRADESSVAAAASEAAAFLAGRR